MCFGKPIWSQLLQVENGLAVLPHLSSQPAKPDDGLAKWITLPVPFALDHALHVVGPDLLSEQSLPLRELPY